MKQIFFFLLLSLVHSFIYAQKSESVPPYQKDSTLPTFSILQTDSTTWFNNLDLPKDKPVIIVYFNPECGHCQLTAHEFQEKMDAFKDVFFVWTCYHVSLSEIKKFAEDYKLLDAPNVRVGKEIKYAIVPFYQVKYTPYMAIYNEKGKLLQTFDGGTDPDTVIRLLHPEKKE